MAQLDRILGNISLPQFLEDYYEKKVLHVSGRSHNFYNDVLTTLEISNYLDRNDIFYPAVRLVKTGKELPLTSYTKNDVPIGHQRKNGLIDTARMMQLFNEHATIVIQAGQRYFDGVASITKNISEIFSSPVQANLYITPTRAQGFNPHWDTHDVFVLQIEGTKTWRLFDFEKYLPTKAQPFKGQKLRSGITETIQLQPGDLLYVPRGYVHDAVADDGVSAHITVGVLAYTWERFFRDAMGQLKNVEEFRKAVPLGHKQFPEMLQAKIEKLLEVLPGLNYESVKQNLHNEYTDRQPQPFRNYFKSLVELKQIDTQTKLGNNTGLFHTVKITGDQLHLSYRNKTINMPAYVQPCMDYIVNRESFTVQEMPGHLTTNGKLVLVRRLVKEGFLFIEHN